ncbi:MAG: hypothetical protein KBS80_09075 [Bacteroidales bacterium]|nr:hypothetical protein [Candidatus Cryptobacteroides choladohippi]
MMRTLFKNIVLPAALFVSAAVSAQTVVQPKIMVIPYTKEGEDIRSVLEEDSNKRIALSKIKEAFDERGVSTIDFVARLKAANTADVMNMDNQADIKSAIINMSGADIYVEAEIICQQSRVDNQTKPETRVKITITAYDIATGASLANKIGECGPFYTDDVAKLSMKAISSIADDFLRVMQVKFSDIAEQGRSVMMLINLDENSNYTMESAIGSQGLLLQDEIELWVDSASYNGHYHLQGVSPLNMVFDDIKLPFVDENGATYTVSKFSMSALKFFRSLGITVSRTLKGNTLYITIK